MLVYSTGSLIGYAGAAVVYWLAPDGSLQDLGPPAFWVFVVLVLAGAIAGNLRAVHDRHRAGAGGSPGQRQRADRHPQRSLVHPSSSIASAISRAFADRSSAADIDGNWVVLVDHDAQRVHMARYLSVVDLDLMRNTVSSL